MARIYLDARNITAQPAGVARYARCLIPELVRQAPEHDFVVIRHASNRDPLFADQIATGRLQEFYAERDIDNLANFLLGHRALADAFRALGSPDLYHDLFHILPLGARLAGPPRMKIAVTLHDLVWIDHPHQSQPDWLTAETIRLFARLAIPRALRDADHVISVSPPTTHRARPWLRDGHHTTIYHGVHPSFFEAPAPPTALLGHLDEPYVVSIGNAKPYKNLALLIRAFARARQQRQQGHLVLIGNCKALRPLLDELGVANHVTLAGFLDDDTLLQVLGHARLFVFPSLVEGFGLPILESMAMGIPTIVSDLEPMRTIADEAALLFQPHDPADLAHLIGRVVADDRLHAALSARSRARARTFRWSETARQTLNVYEGLLAQH